jgi:Arc/MetJ-type ribon-helix-helix transcriptional regulator
MTIQLRPEQERRIHELIKSGRFHTAEEVVNEALDSLAKEPDLSVAEVHRRRLLEFLEKPGCGWKLEEHPELDRGAAHWVESIRRSDEEIEDVVTAP